MSWIRRNPFTDGTDPAEHMVALIAAEAERSGTPFSEADRQALPRNWHPKPIDSDISQDFEEKVKKFIVQTFNHETDPDDARNLGNSVMWAGERNYPLIVALTEEILFERGEPRPLRGRRRMVDRAQLIGCGFAAVVLLMLFAVLVGWLFDRR